MPKELRFKQIAVAPWQGANGMTYSVLALGVNGKVYRYDAGCFGWIEWSTTEFSSKEATCKEEHKGRR